MLLMPDISAHPYIYADNPLADVSILAEVLQDFGITDQPHYPDSSNGDNYIDDKFILTVNRNGTVLYRLRDKGSAVQQDKLTGGEAVGMAGKAVSDTLRRYCGDADVYFDGLRRTGDGSLQVTFRYVAAGGVVRLYGDGLAAIVTVAEPGGADHREWSCGTGGHRFRRAGGAAPLKSRLCGIWRPVLYCLTGMTAAGDARVRLNPVG